MPRDMPASIHISSNSEFFIALCKKGLHSYITLGVRNEDKIEVLAAFGKMGGDDASCCAALFWDTSAEIYNEDFMISSINSKKKQVSYKAYSLKYQHYLHFLHYLKLLSLSQKRTNDDRLFAYCPDKINPFQFDWGCIETFEAPNPLSNTVDFYEHGRLGVLSNSCRHSAIRLTKQATQRTDLGLGISPWFFKNPPLTGVFSNGKLDQISPYFYILPFPPTSFDPISSSKLKIISRLYRRLDEIILSEQTNPMTIEKFEKIKGLYNRLTGDSQLSIFDIMKGIEAWEVENKALISTHRKYHWISFQTATQKMFAHFHKEFAALRNPEQTEPFSFCGLLQGFNWV